MVSEVCPKCGSVAILTHHGQWVCDFKKWKAEQEALGFKYLQYNDDTREILEHKGLNTKVFKWPIADGSGNLVFISVPNWVYEAINVYHNANYADMSLSEFIEKMAPKV